MGIAFSGVSPRPPPNPTQIELMIDGEGAAALQHCQVRPASHPNHNISRAETQSPLLTTNRTTLHITYPWLLLRRHARYSYSETAVPTHAVPLVRDHNPPLFVPYAHRLTT